MVGPLTPNLERRLGPFPLRIWGLTVNFVANGLMLYGAAGYLSDGSRLPLLGLGSFITIACLVLLSKPSKGQS